MDRARRQRLDVSPLLFGVMACLLTAVTARAQQNQAPPGAVRVAVIDVQRLLFESKSGKSVIDKLKNLREQKSAEGDARQQVIKDLRSQIQEGRLSLSEDRLVELEKQLEDKLIELRRFTDDAERDLQKGQEEAFARIEREMMPIITKIGREGGYTLIFNKFNSGLLFAVDEVDITDLVLKDYDRSTQEGG